MFRHQNKHFLILGKSRFPPKKLFRRIAQTISYEIRLALILMLGICHDFYSWIWKNFVFKNIIINYRRLEQKVAQKPQSVLPWNIFYPSVLFYHEIYFTSHSHSYCQQGENKTVTDHISNYGEIIIAERNLMSYRKAVLFQYICTPATVAYVKKTFVI